MIQVCYYAIPREGSSDNTTKFLAVEEIDPFLCTHIVVAFARIRENLITAAAEDDVEVYKKVVDLKKQNSNLKILLSLGGGSSDSGFPSLVRDSEAVVQFASSTREFLLNYSFDGLDLDWEFPAWPVMKKDKQEKQLFTQLVRHLHEALKLTPPLLLTIAVGGPKAIIDRSYEVDQLVKLLNSSWCSVGSPAVGQGMLNGSLSYSEALSFIKEGAKEYFDDDSRVPYAVKNKDWVSYENERSISEKVCWIKSHGFAGVMTWNLNCDDWAGLHSGKRFELHNIIKAILFEDETS